MNSYQSKEKLRLRHVDKEYDGRKILEDINMHLLEGELVSIVGPSGSGKSTIFNIVTALTTYEKGEVIVNGEISYMQQKDLLLPYKTISENVALSLLLKKSSKKEAIEKVKPYFKDFGLEGYEENYPHELSGGMKQRANFLRTYIHGHDLMLLDEPFGALDFITKRNMQKWLLDVRKQYQSTMLLITHDIDEAITLSDRIYVLSHNPATVIGEFASKDYMTEADKTTLKQTILSRLA